MILDSVTLAICLGLRQMTKATETADKKGLQQSTDKTKEWKGIELLFDEWLYRQTVSSVVG